jgi:hypothetical protein
MGGDATPGQSIKIQSIERPYLKPYEAILKSTANICNKNLNQLTINCDLQAFNR